MLHLHRSTPASALQNSGVLVLTQVAIRVAPKTRLSEVFQVLCNVLGLSLHSVKFMYHDVRVSGTHNARMLAMDSDPVYVHDVEV
jgi:glutaminase